MGSKGIGIVSRRPLNEPSLLCLPEEPIFDFTAGIIAIIDHEGFGDRTIGEDDESIGVGVVAFVRIVKNHNDIDGIGREVFAIFVTAAAELSVESRRGELLDPQCPSDPRPWSYFPTSNRAGLIPGFSDAVINQREGIGVNVHVGFGRDIENDVHGLQPPQELAVGKSTIHSQGGDCRMSCQVADGLFNHFTSEIDVADLNGGKTQGKRETTVRVPNDPDLEAKDGFQYLSNTFPASPQFGCFFLGDLAAPRTLLGGLNFRGI